MRLLLLILLMFSTTLSYGQLAQNSKTTLIQGEMYSMEGAYLFEYGGVTHKIIVSSENRTFFEFDENENLLGSGTFIRNSDSFVLRPASITTYSIVNGPIKFEIIEQNETSLSIRLFLSDEQREELELQKL